MAERNLYYLAKYKKSIISLLLNSEPIVELIDPERDDRIELDDLLLGGTFEVPKKETTGTENIHIQGHIFDYLFTPDATDQTQVFLCVETLIHNVVDTYFNECTLYIYVFVPKTRVRLTDVTEPTQSQMIKQGYIGNRVDMLCDAVDRLINGKDDIGIGIVRPTSRNAVTLSVPNTTYYGKCLTYNVKNFIEESECE